MAKDNIRQPVRWMRENIFVTRDGVAYGIWKLEGQAYGLGTIAQKESVRAKHQDFFQALTGEATLLGLVTTSSPETLMGKMLKDVQDPSPQWLEECSLTYQDLAVNPAGERLYFLIAPLTYKTPNELWSTFRRSVDLTLSEAARLTIRPPAERQFTTWKTRMAQIEKSIPASFQAQRVGISALRWITHHLVSRGVESTLPYDHQGIAEVEDWINPSSCLEDPLLDEGGLTDLADEKMPQMKLFKRRFVKVETGDTEPSYQQFSIMGLTPQAGFVFPGAEFVNFAASISHDIDFALRLVITSADKVKAKNRRAENNLKDQYKQRQAGENSIVGGNAEIDKSARALQEYAEELSATDREVEVAASIIFSSSAPTPELAMDEMKDLRDLYTSDEWTLDVPLGGQEKLFWDFWPGTTISSVSNEFAQITTGRNFSMGVPLTNDMLGMPHGFRFGTNVTTGRFSPVLVNLGGLAENDVSGSMAFVGELGSGKSVGMKTIASHSIDRGAQMIAVDHSDNQEWRNLAQSLTTANVVDFMAPDWSLDPLRIYRAPAQRVRETLNLLTTMLGVSVKDDEGIILNAELKKLLNNELEIGSLGHLKDHLASAAVDPADRDVARRVARLMDVFADIDFGETFFNPDLPPMDFSAQATVFCTHGMALPTMEELNNAQARKEMSLDKTMGRASYAYLASVGRNIMYADDSHETLFAVDECHHMTGSPEGTATISEALKTGRKHKGAVLLGTHSALELGPPELRGLIPQRAIFRTRDAQLARQNLEWLDPSYATEEYIDLITKDLSPMDSSGSVPEHRRGEALFRDHLSRIGKIKVLIPRASNRAATVLTSPPKIRIEAEA
ncbi:MULTISPECIES: ATP-binding protein [unclassified Arthrobacter]|uniref:ATP-binding protein n=3 Tax=Arthrobacter TaxID=1663 RepID=UPI000CE48003|nr:MULTISPECIES: ATP-binding protein [unclassified Arthrobacter]